MGVISIWYVDKRPSLEGGTIRGRGRDSMDEMFGDGRMSSSPVVLDAPYEPPLEMLHPNFFPRTDVEIKIFRRCSPFVDTFRPSSSRAASKSVSLSGG